MKVGKDMYTKKRYVAFIDILGFKSIFNNIRNPDDLGDQMSVILQSSIRSALLGKSVNVDDEFDLSGISSIKVYQFSDAIVLYTEDDNDDTLEDLVITLNLLFAQSIIRGFPLRGAITYGDLYVKGSIVVGKPLIEAYQLEGRQEWSGLIVDCDINPQMLSQLKSEKLIVDHEVTLKDQKNTENLIIEEHLVINWPQYCGLRISSPEEFKRNFSRFSGELQKIEHIKKRERTLDFFKNNLGTKDLPSFNFGVGKIIFNSNGEALFLKE